MKKTILIVGWKTGENSFGATVPYLEWLSQFGDVRILMPTDTEVIKADLLVLPGGMDLAPQRFGQVPSYHTGNSDVMKQYFYDVMLEKYIDAGIPIFGICLGLQQLAAYFGSHLTQHLYYHPYSTERWKEAHEVTFINSLKNKFKDDKMKVNSLHHQAVLLQDLSDELEPLMVAKCEGRPALKIVEAFKHKVLPISAVQYHPEEFRDNVSEMLVEDLLDFNKEKNIIGKMMNLIK